MIRNRTHLKLCWRDNGWDQYTKLIYQNKKYIKRINKLIKSIQRDGHRKGLGKPEPLRNIKWSNKSEVWSRRITSKDRLVYIVPVSPSQNEFEVVSCLYHYYEN